jgi:hypothetical protein
MNTIPRRLRVAAQSPSWPDDPRVSAYRAFIRALPCAACGKPPPSEVAHFGMPAGLGPPLAERCLVPLCGPPSLWDDCCHSRKYFLGAAPFWSGLRIDPRRLALRLRQISGDVAAGAQEVRRAGLARMASPQHTRGGPRARGTPSEPSASAGPFRLAPYRP